MTGRTVMSITYSWCGPLDEGERALRPLRSFGTPIEDVVEVMDYCALQQVIDERFPAGRQHYWKSNFLTDLSDEAIDVMLRLRGGAALAGTRPRCDGTQPRRHRPAARAWRCGPGRPDRDGVSASPRPPRFPHPLAVDRSRRCRAPHHLDARVLRGDASLHRARRLRQRSRRGGGGPGARGVWSELSAAGGDQGDATTRRISSARTRTSNPRWSR